MIKDPSIKKCQRCHEKLLVHQKKCPFCGLVFEKLKYVSNKASHKNVIQFKRKNYLMVTEWPSDVNKKTALFLCAFLGMFGAHNFYLGRFYKGIIVLFGMLSAIALVFIDYASMWHNVVYYISAIPAMCVLIFWVLDFVKIFLEKYKIPVSIDEKLYNLKDKVE